MAYYNNLNVKLCNSQFKKMKSGTKNTGVTLEVSIDMIRSNET